MKKNKKNKEIETQNTFNIVFRNHNVCITTARTVGEKKVEQSSRHEKQRTIVDDPRNSQRKGGD